MTIKTSTSNVKDLYRDWLVKSAEYMLSNYGNYTKLLEYLYSRSFYWVIPNDENRANDGLSLRRRFVTEGGCTYGDILRELNSQCTVLEMMLAACLRVEENLYDPDLGSRTGKWLYDMIYSMRLDREVDTEFDEAIACEAVDLMLSRRYSKDGLGGLFWVPNAQEDFREIEIWYQMQYYMNTR